MSEPNQDTHFVPQPTGPGLKIPILFGLVIALAAANVYLFLQLDQVRTEMASMRDSMLDEVSNLRETSTVTNQTQERRLESIREELEAARRQAAVAAGQAKTEATQRAEELARQLEAEQARQRQEQERTAQELSQGLSQVATATDENKSTIGQVQTQVTETKTELEKTISALTAVTGDLGVQSGLIATNAKELAALRELGDRDYFEFDITRNRQPTKVGDIAIRLKDTNRNRGRFTLDVIADDKTVEKRQRTINEPLQFYVSSARQPYELVINTVERNRIVGYLAVPKVKIPRRTPADSTGG